MNQTPSPGTPTSPTRTHRAWWRSLLCACGALAVVVGFALPGGAGAATTVHRQEQTPGEVDSWSLSPSGVEPGQPGARPDLSYTLAPGESVDDSVVLRNYGNVPLTFRIYATDAFNSPNGDYALIEGSKPPSDVGSWIHVSQESILLAPGTGIDIPFTITVPADAQPGDHAGALLASSKTSAQGPKGRQVLLDRRTGPRVYLRVKGPLNPGLVVDNLSVTYHGGLNPLDGSVDVSYTVHNTGNVRLGARQTVAIDDLFGTASERKGTPIPQLLPGNSVDYHEHFSGIAATVRISAAVTLSPFGPQGVVVDKQPTTTASSSAWAIPWLLVVLLALIVVAVVLVRRRRRAHGTPGPRPPRAGPPGSGGGAPNGRHAALEPPRSVPAALPQGEAGVPR